MEWQFCINWPALVEEAKLRRKAQKLTQQAAVSSIPFQSYPEIWKGYRISFILKTLQLQVACNFRRVLQGSHVLL